MKVLLHTRGKAIIHLGNRRFYLWKKTVSAGSERGWMNLRTIGLYTIPKTLTLQLQKYKGNGLQKAARAHVLGL